MKENILEKLNAFAIEENTWKEKAKWEIENSAWLELSAQVAVRVLSTIRNGNEIKSQKELAERMHVSPQYINKIVKGRENLSLDTIVRIEKALNIKLIEIVKYPSDNEYNIVAEKYEGTI